MKPTSKEHEQAIQQSLNDDLNSDWGRARPTHIDFDKIWRKYPAHRNCDLVIRPSRKNPTYVGLYCKKHDQWLTWLNSLQIINGRDLGIEYEQIPSPRPVLRITDLPLTPIK